MNPTALLINGSPRKNGPTSEILRMIAHGLGERFQSRTLEVSDLVLRPCLGCGRCRPDGRCPLPADGTHEAGDLLAAADLIVVGTPVYWGNMTAQLKMIFDRNVTTFEHFGASGPVPVMTGKRGIIAVNGGSGPGGFDSPTQGGGAVQALRTVLESGGVAIAGTLQVAEAWDFERQREQIARDIGTIIETL